MNSRFILLDGYAVSSELAHTSTNYRSADQALGTAASRRDLDEYGRCDEFRLLRETVPLSPERVAGAITTRSGLTGAIRSRRFATRYSLARGVSLMLRK